LQGQPSEPVGDPVSPEERQKGSMTSEAAEIANIPFDEETALVRRCLAGDAAAFDRLYARYRDKVYVLAMGILMNPDDAADAVQETFSLAYRNLPKFRAKSRFGTWLFRIAVNSAIQFSRRHKYRSRLTSLDDAAAVPAPGGDERNFDEGALRAAMACLKPEDRAVLTLFYWEGLPLEEIGESLGCAPNAAKTRLYRARERLRSQLRKESASP